MTPSRATDREVNHITSVNENLLLKHIVYRLALAVIVFVGVGGVSGETDDLTEKGRGSRILRRCAKACAAAGKYSLPRTIKLL